MYSLASFLNNASYQGTVTYAITAGSLPTNASLNASTGVITYTNALTTNGTVSVTIRATNVYGNTGIVTLNFNIVAPYIVPVEPFTGSMPVSGTLYGAAFMEYNSQLNLGTGNNQAGLRYSVASVPLSWTFDVNYAAIYGNNYNFRFGFYFYDTNTSYSSSVPSTTTSFNGYFFYIQNDASPYMTLFRKGTSVATSSSSMGFWFGTGGATLRISFSSGTINVHQNGTLVLSYTDTSYTQVTGISGAMYHGIHRFADGQGTYMGPVSRLGSLVWAQV